MNGGGTITTDYRNIPIDDMEDHSTDGNGIVVDQDGSKWAAEAGDDVLDTVVADTRLFGNQCYRIFDEDRTKHSANTITLDTPAVVGDILTIGGIYPVTGLYAKDVVYVKLREGATICIYLRINLLTGQVDYSTDDGSSFSDTTIDVTLDAANLIFEIELTSSSTFKLRLHNGSWTSALDNDNSITTSITKLEFASAVDNDDGGSPYALVEDCSTHADGNNMAGDAAPNGTWSTPVPDASCSVKWKDEGSGAMCVECIDANASGTFGSPYLTFTSAGSPNGTDSISYKVKVMNYAGVNVIVAEGGTYRVGIQLAPGGSIIGGSGWADLGIGSWTLNTWHTIEIVFLSTSTFKCRIDGGSWSATKTNNNGNWSSAGAVIDRWWISGSTGYQFTVRYDEIQASWVTGTTYTAGSIDIYFDELYLRQATVHDKLQIKKWKLHSTNEDIKLAECLPLYQSDGSILVAVEDTVDNTFDVYRVSGNDYSTWTKVIDTGSSTAIPYQASVSIMFCSPSAGTVYCIYKNDGTNSYLAKSTDYGVNWTINASCGIDNVIYDIFCIGTTVFLMAWDTLNCLVYKLTDDTPTLLLRDSEGIAPEDYIPQCRGFVSDSVYYFAAFGGTKYLFLKYEDTTPLIQTLKSSAAQGSNMENTRLLALVRDPNTVWTYNSAGHMYIPGQTEDTPILGKTENGANTFSDVETGLLVGTDEAQLSTDDPRLAVDVEELECLLLDTEKHNFNHIPNPAWTGYTSIINIAKNIIMCSDGTDTLVFEYGKFDADELVDCSISDNIATSTYLCGSCDIEVTMANKDMMPEGCLIELYDRWDALWFKGLVYKVEPIEGIVNVHAIDVKRELSRLYATNLLAKASEIMTTLVNALRFGFLGTIEDVNYNGGNVDYDISGHDNWQRWLATYRLLERVFVWTTPAGEWNACSHDNATSLKLRIHEKKSSLLDLTQWGLLDDEKRVDLKWTRSSVRYASGRQQYTGNAAAEMRYGQNQIPEHVDSALAVAGDALNVAEQVYAVFSQNTKFVHLLVGGHGFKEMAHSIDLSWDEGAIQIARADWVIIAMKARPLQDIVEYVLTNNILLEVEAEDGHVSQV